MPAVLVRGLKALSQHLYQLVLSPLPASEDALKGASWAKVAGGPNIIGEGLKVFYRTAPRVFVFKGGIKMADVKFDVVPIKIPEGCNVILGHSHFIKTVEDLYEILVTTSPYLKFGIAFCEASGPRLIRKDGNDKDLIDVAVENALAVAAGHFFIIVLKDGYPINCLNAIKNCQEVCRIFTATANPLQVIIAETEQGRAVIGVVDGFTPLGVEEQQHIEERKKLLREIIGYKR